MKKLSLIALTVLSLSLAACGGSDSPVEVFDDFVASNNALVASYCDCTPDPAGCKTQQTIPASVLSCMRGVVDANADAVETFLNCQADATANGASCIDGVAACDEMAIEACFDAMDTATDACGELPAAIDDMFSACFPE